METFFFIYFAVLGLIFFLGLIIEFIFGSSLEDQLEPFQIKTLRKNSRSNFFYLEIKGDKKSYHLNKDSLLIIFSHVDYLNDNLFEYYISQWELAPFDITITDNMNPYFDEEKCHVLGFFQGQPRLHICLLNNLNRKQFPLVFLHEIAHLRVHLKYKTTKASHGKEFNKEFANLIWPILGKGVTFKGRKRYNLIEYFHNIDSYDTSIIPDP